MQIFWEWNKLVSSIRGCHNRARCGLGAKVTDILSKDISGVAVEAGEYVSPSESLFEGTQFEGPFLIGPPPPTPWPQPQSTDGYLLGLPPLVHGKAQ